MEVQQVVKQRYLLLLDALMMVEGRFDAMSGHVSCVLAQRRGDCPEEHTLKCLLLLTHLLFKITLRNRNRLRLERVILPPCPLNPDNVISQTNISRADLAHANVILYLFHIP